MEPLEEMIGNDDQAVRDKAVQAMKLVGRKLNDKTLR